MVAIAFTGSHVRSVVSDRESRGIYEALGLQCLLSVFERCLLSVILCSYCLPLCYTNEVSDVGSMCGCLLCELERASTEIKLANC